MSKRLLSYAQLRTEKGITLSKPSIWRAERDGRFPKRVNPSPGTVAWVEDEIDVYIADLIAVRDAQAPKAA